MCDLGQQQSSNTAEWQQHHTRARAHKAHAQHEDCPWHMHIIACAAGLPAYLSEATAVLHYTVLYSFFQEAMRRTVTLSLVSPLVPDNGTWGAVNF